jgi:alkylation response protein AidB-like acyl-CoA dehydrogenase
VCPHNRDRALGVCADLRASTIRRGVCGGLGIGLPPVLHFGSPALQDKVAPGCLSGDKFICLAITEPYAGSDVAALRCTAVKDPSGKFYVVNGEKKWITNGVFADFFTVAVRTGGEGAGGISLLVVERGPGVITKQMDCMGVWSSGTTYITFEDVKVPVENLIGEEGEGFKYSACLRYGYRGPFARADASALCITLP